MIVFHYDKSLEGLLTALFDAYVRKSFPEKLLACGEPEPLFTAVSHTVVADRKNASRVWKGVEKKIGKQGMNMLMHVWLSEEPGSDELIFRYMRKVLDLPQGYAMNFADDDVLEIKQLAHKVSREAEHLRQFVRFQKGGDGTYFAPVDPKYNALPIAIAYFTDRFADQRWLIYDTSRRYGYYYDLEKTIEITMDQDGHLLSGKLCDEMMAADEKLFQRLWKNYLKALTIKERYNPGLQRHHMPRRFWKYLTEKQ